MDLSKSHNVSAPCSECRPTSETTYTALGKWGYSLAYVCLAAGSALDLASFEFTRKPDI
jgi:hypothetical protein